ncbi:MAG: hypothetical protein ACFFD4_31410 [Candidatus Odinarchaeota archaeon]
MEMIEMKISVSYLLIIFILFTVMPISGHIVDNEIKSGDLFVYEMTKFDVPWSFLSTENFTVVRPLDCVVNLAGSELLVSVNAFTAENKSDISSYFSLNKDTLVPYPDNMSDTYRNKLGNNFVLPKDCLIRYGNSLPYNAIFRDLVIDSKSGLPFYLSPANWENYARNFTELVSEWRDGRSITTKTTTECIVEVSGIPNADNFLFSNLTLVWYASGDHLGVFKSFKGKTGMVVNGSAVDLEIDYHHISKSSQTLPAEIVNGEDIILKMEKGDISYKLEGVFDDDDLESFFAEKKQQIKRLEGKDAVKYQITGYDGPCYNYSRSSYNLSLERLDGGHKGYWLNDYSYNTFIFDGSSESIGGDEPWENKLVVGIGGDEPWDNKLVSGFGEEGIGGDEPWENKLTLGFNEEGIGGDEPWENKLVVGIGGDEPWENKLMKMAISPVNAPAITPNWNTWKESSHLVISTENYLADIYQLNYDSYHLEENHGMTVNTFEISYEFKEGITNNYFVSSISLDVMFSADDLGGLESLPLLNKLGCKISATDTSHYLGEYKNDTYYHLVYSAKTWTAYTKTGLLAGKGSNTVVDINMLNMPEIGSSGSTEFVNGSMQLTLFLVLKNTVVENLEIPYEISTTSSSKEQTGFIPGFTIIPAAFILFIYTLRKKSVFKHKK